MYGCVGEAVLLGSCVGGGELLGSCVGGGVLLGSCVGGGELLGIHSEFSKVQALSSCPVTCLLAAILFTLMVMDPNPLRL